MGTRTYTFSPAHIYIYISWYKVEDEAKEGAREERREKGKAGIYDGANEAPRIESRPNLRR